MLGWEKEVFTRGKLDVLESSWRFFATTKTRRFVSSLSKENMEPALIGEDHSLSFRCSVSIFFQ